MNPFFEMKQMNSHRNSIPKLKFYDTQHIFHHEYFSSRHNSSAAIMTTSTAGSATGSAISPVASRRPDIIKVCSKFFISLTLLFLSLSLCPSTHFILLSAQSIFLFNFVYIFLFALRMRLVWFRYCEYSVYFLPAIIIQYLKCSIVRLSIILFNKIEQLHFSIVLILLWVDSLWSCYA